MIHNQLGLLIGRPSGPCGPCGLTSERPTSGAHEPPACTVQRSALHTVVPVSADGSPTARSARWLPNHCASARQLPVGVAAPEPPRRTTDPSAALLRAPIGAGWLGEHDADRRGSPSSGWRASGSRAGPPPAGAARTRTSPPGPLGPGAPAVSLELGAGGAAATACSSHNAAQAPPSALGRLIALFPFHWADVRRRHDAA